MRRYFFFLLLIFILGCTQQELPQPQPVPEQIIEPPPVIEKVPEQVIEEPQKEKFKIIQPTLTYPGAYNGPLYATSEQVGGTISIDKYMANLDRNGVNWFIGFFTFMEEPKENNLVRTSGLGRIIYGVQKYPGRIIPYYNPGLGGEEVESLLGEKLTSFYTTVVPSIKNVAGEGFLQGLGEIETQEWTVDHSNPKVLQLFDLAKSHNLNFMFHPVASKIDQVERIAKAYPRQKIIIHMYREDLGNSMPEVIRILNENNNIYFSIDAAHIAHTDGMDILYDNEGSSAFNRQFDNNYENMLDDAVQDYKDLVEGAPTKVMWGTEAGPAYSFEPETYDRLIKISREFIGRMPPQYQEGLAYKNALGFFGEGVILEKEIIVMDSSKWPYCTNDQMGQCDIECGIEEEEVEDPALESCFQNCLIGLKCRDVIEQN